MPGVGSKIVANDYNTIQSAIAGVLGQNSAGYGQAPSSSQVASTSKITAAQWNALQNDISAVNYHQLNAAPSYSGSGLTTASTSIKIKESDRAAYLAVAQALASSSSINISDSDRPYSAIIFSYPNKKCPSFFFFVIKSLRYRFHIKLNENTLGI